MRLVLDRNVRVRMRDGVELATDVLRPEVEERVPVIFSRTPYDRTLVRVGDLTEHPELAERGYAVVTQDVRGRYASGGTFAPYEQEIPDGYDAVEWCARQPWSSGRVAMHGASYLGATQWLAAMAKPPGLWAIIPNITSADYHEGWTYQGGAFQLGFMLRWAYADWLAGNPGPSDLERDRGRIEALDAFEAVNRRRPLIDHPLVERWAPFYRAWLTRPHRDAWWRSIAPRQHWAEMSVPALNIGGWYDIFVAGTIDNFVGMRGHAATPEARTAQRLIVGPWSHRTIQASGEFADRRYGVAGTVGGADLVGEHLRWFDRWLKDDAGAGPGAPVRVFVMGRNQWREAEDWPLPGTAVTPMWLHSGGQANSLTGDGELSFEPPAASESSDTFVFDPLNPVPSMGGPTLSQIAGLPGWNAGPYDQREVEMRDDVLCYTSAPLAAPLDVIGPIELVLYASSSALDTDFTAKLVDVWPNGRAENLTDGIIRARYRESLAEPRALVPDKLTEFRIAVGPTANAFLAGHRIRLEVSSSNFPRFDPNTNTGGDTALEGLDALRRATNRVFHERAWPSRLLLPVAPPA